MTCPKCQAAMKEGFVLDRDQSRNRVEEWVEGEPEPSFWTGVKRLGRTRIEIATYRCPKCGYLESYAR